MFQFLFYANINKSERGTTWLLCGQSVKSKNSIN